MSSTATATATATRKPAPLKPAPLKPAAKVTPAAAPKEQEPTVTKAAPAKAKRLFPDEGVAGAGVAVPG